MLQKISDGSIREQSLRATSMLIKSSRRKQFTNISVLNCNLCIHKLQFSTDIFQVIDSEIKMVPHYYINNYTHFLGFSSIELVQVRRKIDFLKTCHRCSVLVNFSTYGIVVEQERDVYSE